MVDCLRGGGCRLADTIVSAIPDLDHLGSLDLILHGFFSLVSLTWLPLTSA